MKDHIDRITKDKYTNKDGKFTLYQGSCFEWIVIAKIRELENRIKKLEFKVSSGKKWLNG